MKSGDGKADAKDIKKLIGNPKVIFAIGRFHLFYFFDRCVEFLGGPASGKGT